MPFFKSINSYLKSDSLVSTFNLIEVALNLTISKINNLDISIDEIALFLNRGNRSGIGVQSFKQGGFTIDIGKKKGTNNIPLKLMKR